MELTEGLRSRSTVRCFRQQPVGQDIISAILNDARWAPSASNQQPWHFFVLTGEPLAALCASIQSASLEKKAAYDPSKGRTIPPAYVDRTRKLFKEIRPFISGLGDAQRSFIEAGSFRFYDAPVVVFIAMHKSMPHSRLMDIGMASQNIMLSAHARGVGSCAIALTLLYADVIVRELGLSDDLDLVLSIALGYPETASQVNVFRSSREALENLVVWYGFTSEQGGSFPGGLS